MSAHVRLRELPPLWLINGDEMLETTVQNHIRERFAHIGPIWRNNSGACTDVSGRLIRYGLGNDSAKLNAHIKSSDLIGIRPQLAFLPDTGWQILGIFTAIEVKSPGWKFSENDHRAVAQRKFHDIVRASGGLAGFASSTEDINRIITL